MGWESSLLMIVVGILLAVVVVRVDLCVGRVVFTKGNYHTRARLCVCIVCVLAYHHVVLLFVRVKLVDDAIKPLVSRQNNNNHVLAYLRIQLLYTNNVELTSADVFSFSSPTSEWKLCAQPVE